MIGVQVNKDAVETVINNSGTPTTFTNKDSGGEITVTSIKDTVVNIDPTKDLTKERNTATTTINDIMPTGINNAAKRIRGNLEQEEEEGGGKKSRRRRKGKGKKGKSMKRRGTRGKKAKK